MLHLVGRKRERKERGGGKREKKMEKCVFGMERKMEVKEKWKEKMVCGAHHFVSSQKWEEKGRKERGKKWCVGPTIF